MAWIKQNWRQFLVAMLSATAATIIQLRPEWRSYVLAAAGVLGLFGLHLPPVSYGGASQESAPKREDLQ
jgi:hypothetical protein